MSNEASTRSDEEAHEATTFDNQFKKDEEVYYNGARGSTGPFYIDQVLDNGTYKLRGKDGKKHKKTYEEGDLSKLPRVVS
ncbi:MAG: hypothetical protein Q9202_004405 [Teloschistes flavicans]